VNLLKPCLSVQLLRTHAVVSSLRSLLEHIQAWSVGAQVELATAWSRQVSWLRISRVQSFLIVITHRTRRESCDYGCYSIRRGFCVYGKEMGKDNSQPIQQDNRKPHCFKVKYRARQNKQVLYLTPTVHMGGKGMSYMQVTVVQQGVW